MQLDEKVLRNDELAVFRLRALYQQYGYTRFKMSKFEEYDLYVRNKDFLISENVITFNDLNGKLLALKPDVTLSIVKNTPDVPGAIQRVYYNESIYRPEKGSRSFKEIMQTGLECLGAIDTDAVCEVVLLALKSLEAIRPDFVLDISHMGLISAIMDDYFVPGEAQKKIVQFCGKFVVLSASVQVLSPMKFCIILPSAENPVSMMYTGCPPKIRT